MEHNNNNNNNNNNKSGMNPATSEGQQIHNENHVAADSIQANIENINQQMMENSGNQTGNKDTEFVNGQGTSQQGSKRKYHRFTAEQIKEMEAAFEESPHLVDSKKKKELSMKLGLEPSQVKFWFQNKRTQIKVPKHSKCHFC